MLVALSRVPFSGLAIGSTASVDPADWSIACSARNQARRPFYENVQPACWWMNAYLNYKYSHKLRITPCGGNYVPQRFVIETA